MIFDHCGEARIVYVTRAYWHGMKVGWQGVAGENSLSVTGCISPVFTRDTGRWGTRV